MDSKIDPLAMVTTVGLGISSVLSTGGTIAALNGVPGTVTIPIAAASVGLAIGTVAYVRSKWQARLDGQRGEEGQ